MEEDFEIGPPEAVQSPRCAEPKQPGSSSMWPRSNAWLTSLAALLMVSFLAALIVLIVAGYGAKSAAVYFLGTTLNVSAQAMETGDIGLCMSLDGISRQLCCGAMGERWADVEKCGLAGDVACSDTCLRQVAVTLGDSAICGTLNSTSPRDTCVRLLIQRGQGKWNSSVVTEPSGAGDSTSFERH